MAYPRSYGDMLKDTNGLGSKSDIVVLRGRNSYG